MTLANSIGLGVCLALIPYMGYQLLIWILDKILPNAGPEPVFLGSRIAAMKFYAAPE